jgi:hypothetical protein
VRSEGERHHRANPLPPTTDALKRSHDLFHRDCEQCHGKAGHGDGPLAASLLPRPAVSPYEALH